MLLRIDGVVHLKKTSVELTGLEMVSAKLFLKKKINFTYSRIYGVRPPKMFFNFGNLKLVGNYNFANFYRHFL